MIDKKGNEIKMAKTGKGLKDLNLSSDTVVIDSGTSILALPTEDVNTLIGVLNDSDFKCKYSKKLSQIVCKHP